MEACIPKLTPYLILLDLFLTEISKGQQLFPLLFPLAHKRGNRKITEKKKKNTKLRRQVLKNIENTE